MISRLHMVDPDMSHIIDKSFTVTAYIMAWYWYPVPQLLVFRHQWARSSLLRLYNLGDNQFNDRLLAKMREKTPGTMLLGMLKNEIINFLGFLLSYISTINKYDNIATKQV